MIKYLLLITIPFTVFATTKIKDNQLKLGKADSNDVYIYANNGNANLPFIFYDFSESKWNFSEDGTNLIELDDTVSSLTLNNSDQITLSTTAKKQVITVVGNASAVTLNSLAFSNNPKNASEIILIGSDDTNTVTILYNDVANGLLLNGDAALGKGYALTLIYNQSLSRFVEISRNF